MGNPITDWWTGDSPERRQLREAKSRRDIGYDPDTGLSTLMNGKEVVIAPKNGVPGFLEPTTGKWIMNSNPNNEAAKQSNVRYRQVLEGNKAENARAAKGGFLQPKTRRRSQPITEAKTKAELVKKGDGLKPPVETPPVETPPVETPPVETPPVETPPVETPPVETPPVETPPVETPPVETPPVETPPVETTSVSPGERRNENGIVQKGMTLGGVKNYLQGSGFELSDIGQVFELPSSFGVQTPAATETSPKPTASVPGTTGGDPANPQDGASSKPDETEAATEIKFDHPNGKQSDWMKPGSARNLAVQAFLDPKNKGYGAIKARNAAVGLADIPYQGLVARSGDNHYEYTGKGKASDVAFDITGGKKGFIKHQDDFTLLESPESTPEPGTPAPDDEQTPATLPTKDDITAFAQDFATSYKAGFKKK